MALLNPASLSGVVSLVAGDRGVGTAFLYERSLTDPPDRRITFMVTNNHVVEAGATHVRFNRIDGGTGLVTAQEATRAGVDWFRHPTSDVAVLPLPPESPLASGGADHLHFTDNLTPTTEEWQRVTEGYGVFVLGFPMGLVGEHRTYPIVRHGVIARIQDWRRGDTRSFLIDSAAFPGNSGGPVLLQPEAMGLANTESIRRSLLLGIVSSYIPYADVAISTQTGRPRVTFEENSGLAEVVPIDMAKECCDAAIAVVTGGRGTAPEPGG